MEINDILNRYFRYKNKVYKCIELRNINGITVIKTDSRLTISILPSRFCDIEIIISPAQNTISSKAKKSISFTGWNRLEDICLIERIKGGMLLHDIQKDFSYKSKEDLIKREIYLRKKGRI